MLLKYQPKLDKLDFWKKQNKKIIEQIVMNNSSNIEEALDIELKIQFEIFQTLNNFKIKEE